jgi:hypothetical protein
MVPDRDRPSYSGFHQFAGGLKSKAASIKMVVLKAEFRESNGFDVRDILKRPDGNQSLKASITSAMDWTPDWYEPEGAAGKPRVIIPGPQSTTIHAARKLGELMAKHPHYCIYGDVLVHIDGEKVAEPGADEMTSAFESVATLINPRTEEVHDIPATTARKIIHSRDFKTKIRNVDVISRCPLLVEKDGELVLVSGYCEKTRTLAHGKPAEEIKLDDAVRLLRSLLRDFEFKTPAEESRAVGNMIAPCFVRGGITPFRFPFALMEANRSQAGKDKALKITAAIYGERVSTFTVRTGGAGSTREDFDKYLVEEHGFISIDNVRGKFDSSFLESFLTEDLYVARPSYRSPHIIDARRTVVSMTSNRPEMTEDLAPILDGFIEATQIITNPNLVWLKQVAQAVIRASRGGEELRPSDVANILTATDVDLPGLTIDEHDERGIDMEPVFLAVGRKLGRCFPPGETYPNRNRRTWDSTGGTPRSSG